MSAYILYTLTNLTTLTEFESITLGDQCNSAAHLLNFIQRTGLSFIDEFV